MHLQATSKRHTIPNLRRKEGASLGACWLFPARHEDELGTTLTLQHVGGQPKFDLYLPTIDGSAASNEKRILARITRWPNANLTEVTQCDVLDPVTHVRALKNGTLA